MPVKPVNGKRFNLELCHFTSVVNSHIVINELKMLEHSRIYKKLLSSSKTRINTRITTVFSLTAAGSAQTAPSL